MRRRALVAYGVGLAAICGTSHAPADEPQAVFIWYRSGGECPDGPQFLSRLDGKIEGARIAVAGDPIDFVVTLGSLGKRSNGRLERETSQGKVAIREIDSEDCAEVAEALALSLALALDPAAKPKTAENTTKPEPVDTPTPVRRSNPTNDVGVDRATPRKRDAATWSIGAQGSVASAIAPSLLPGGFLFADVERTRASVLPGASLRLGAMGRFATTMTSVGNVRYRLLGARVEGCPIRIGSESFAAKPCAGFDIGQLRVEGDDDESGLSDTGAWASAGVNGRLVWRAARTLALELDVGAFAPLTRYTLGTGDPTLTGHRTDFLGFSAGLGASAILP